MTSQLLVAIVPGDLRDDLIDALIQLPEISGFGMQAITWGLPSKRRMSFSNR